MLAVFHDLRSVPTRGTRAAFGGFRQSCVAWLKFVANLLGIPAAGSDPGLDQWYQSARRGVGVDPFIGVDSGTLHGAVAGGMPQG